MKVIIFIAIFFVVASHIVYAGVGVGVNLGKIKIDEPLKPGGVYNFPVIGVINTGDQEGDYEMEVTYHQDQPELKPVQEWFDFSPAKFHLKAGESRSVSVKLSLPMRTKPGDYFAYLEAHPVAVSKSGGTAIGVAAATKAYFTVIPANIWQAMYYKVLTLFSMYTPWTYVVLAVIGGAVILTLLKRFFTFQIKIGKKHDNSR